MSSLEIPILDCLSDENLNRHLDRSGKDILRIYPCVDSCYYHLKVNEQDYIEFRNKFILDMQYENDTRFELLTKYDLTLAEFVYFKVYQKNEGKARVGGREKIENEIPLCKIGFKNPLVKNGREMIFIQLDETSTHHKGAVKTDFLIKNILNEYGLDILGSKITRIDYSMLVEGYDFSYLESSLFKRRSPKSSYIQDNTFDDNDLNFDKSTKELMNFSYENRDKKETLYLGDLNYCGLRIYDKLANMYSKGDLVKDLILCYRLGYEYPSDMKHLWNIEFECHRDFLKKYSIDTFEDAINASTSLFQELMLNKFALLSSHRTKRNSHRIPISPLWKRLSDSYLISGVKAVELNKIKQKAHQISMVGIIKIMEKHCNLNTIPKRATDILNIALAELIKIQETMPT